MADVSLKSTAPMATGTVNTEAGLSRQTESAAMAAIMSVVWAVVREEVRAAQVPGVSGGPVTVPKLALVPTGTTGTGELMVRAYKFNNYSLS